MEKLYSTIFIVDISQNPEEVDTVASRIQQLIEDHGGIIKKVDRWGKRRLAYPIQKLNYGFYVEMEFTANSALNIPTILEKEYRINDRVLRYLTYVVVKKELIQRAKMEGKAKAVADQRTAAAAKEKEPVVQPAAAPEPPAATKAPVPDSAPEEKIIEPVAKSETAVADVAEESSATETAPEPEAATAAEKTAETETGVSADEIPAAEPEKPENKE